MPPSLSPYHGKIYWEEIDPDTKDSLSDTFLLFEVDSERGFKKSGELDWQDFGSGLETIVIQNPSSNTTFTLETGYLEGTSEINARWKYAAVSGRQAYIGNVQQPVDYGESMVDWNNGLILKGSIGSPGGFSDKQYIDLELGSDYITYMISQADRLFVFSKKKLTIINIAQDLEFLEDEFEGYGVMGPRQVTKVEGGIAIINSTGVHLFNGKEFISISDENLRSNVRWYHNKCKIIYEPLRKNLFCWSNTTILWIYNLVLKQWVYSDMNWKGLGGQQAVPTTNSILVSVGTENFSNVVPKILSIFYSDSGTPGWYHLDYAGYRILTNNNNGESDEASKNRIFVTGNIDLGDLSRRKKIYKIRLNCTTTAGSVTEDTVVDPPADDTLGDGGQHQGGQSDDEDSVVGDITGGDHGHHDPGGS